jgi:hypothetical protein
MYVYGWMDRAQSHRLFFGRGQRKLTLLIKFYLLLALSSVVCTGQVYSIIHERRDFRPKSSWLLVSEHVSFDVDHTNIGFEGFQFGKCGGCLGTVTVIFIEEFQTLEMRAKAVCIDRSIDGLTCFSD